MGKRISEIGVEDLVGAGLSVEEAKGLERVIKDAEKQTISGFLELDPKQIWSEIMTRKALKPWHPHSLHQLVYYHGYDEYISGPPVYWFPSLTKTLRDQSVSESISGTNIRSNSSLQQLDALHGFLREGDADNLLKCIENGVAVNVKG